MAKSNQAWLLAKEIPYAMTLLLSAIGWCLAHAADEVEKSPTVAFTKQVVAEGDRKNQLVEFTVTNISRKTLFQRVSFYIEARDKGVLSDPDANPVPPAKVGEDDNVKPKIEADQLARFFIAQFQPGTQWRLSARLAGSECGDADLRFDFSDSGIPARPGHSQAKTEPVALRLVPAGAETWLVQHQIGMLLIAALIWGALAIAYLIKVQPSEK